MAEKETEFKDYRKESRKTYGRQMLTESGVNVDQLNCGSFMRMADSLESIAKSKTELEEEVQRLRETAEYYRDYARRQNERLNECRNSRAGYKGRMNRLQREKDEIIEGLEKLKEHGYSITLTKQLIEKHTK